MRLLVDTHILIWALEANPKLSSKARELLRDSNHEHWVSAASVWEIAIKSTIRKLTLSRPLRELEKTIIGSGFQVLSVTAQHAAATVEIKLPHNDPFDRLLVAQCEVETLRFVTADQSLAKVPSVILV